MGDQLTLDELEKSALDLSVHSDSENTKRAYRRDWSDFTNFCIDNKLQPVPADSDTIALYIAYLAPEHKAATIKRKLYAIAWAHRQVDPKHRNPIKAKKVYDMLDNLALRDGETPERKEAVHSEQIVAALCSQEEETTTDVRDKTIILVCYAGGFKRSDLVKVKIEDITRIPEGLAIACEKKDINGEQLVKIISRSDDPKICPVSALESWLKISKIKSGPLFRPIDRHGNIGDTALTPQSISLVIKGLAPLLGIDPRRVASHSLLAGAITDLLLAGADDEIIMLQTGHKRQDALDPYKLDARRRKFGYTTAMGLKSSGTSR